MNNHKSSDNYSVSSIHPSGKNNCRKRGISRKKRIRLALILSIVFICAFTLGGTIAYISTNTAPVENVFIPTEFKGDIPEDFDGMIKKNVYAENTGEVDAYVRVKLLSSMVDAEGNQVAIPSTVPDFTPGEGWRKSDEYYYYIFPLKVGEKTAVPLIGDEGISLAEKDGNHQVIDVVAQFIQAEGQNSQGIPAVTDAWGISVDPETGVLLFE